MQIPDLSGFNLPPPRVQLHPSPQYLLLLGLLLLACLVLLIAFGCLLVAADVLGHERRVRWGKRVMKSLVMFGGSMAVVEFSLCASYINYIIVNLQRNENYAAAAADLMRPVE